MKDTLDLENHVTCKTHGKQIGGIVCNHLLTGHGLGFFEPEPPAPASPQAWCFKCDEVYIEEKGFTKKFEDFSYLRLICIVCYEKVKKRNFLHLI